MLKRTITDNLLKWKDNKKRKPLILTGVRQCGKTYIIQEFGKTFFDSVAYFNFEKNPELNSIFEYNYDVERILSELENIFLKNKIIVGSTLVILDEIQMCPKAITSLKYFCENKRELHIIAAGSLLGVALKSDEIAFPVGKVDRLKMYPMSFREFVIADGGEKYLDGIEKYDIYDALPEAYTMQMEKYLKLYYIIGGMPEVVQTWIDTHDLSLIDELQDSILQDYSGDFSKHAPINQIPKLNMIWDSIPKQLAKDNNKFVFSHVKEGARSKELEDALEWLVDAGLIYRLECVEKPELPLSAFADATYFKVYMADIGLLRRKANVYYRTILDGSEGYIRFKGALAENYVLSELNILNLPSWFWRSGNSAELDFITEYQGEMYPIEVKSADNTRAKSLQQFISRYTTKKAFKCSLKNVGINENDKADLISLPLYLLYKLKDYMC